jgi:diaminohydroxyphosphoribosylaminopyrimidine deaminase/5-amino-6-(5-phosphoribosylamino)uracil reductase
MNDIDYMKLALQNAKSTQGQTSPNPVVGAVLVNDHRIVGIGVHLKAGEPHAEVHAIQMAKEKANGSTLYVTLEPCSHFGRTPPCADLVIESGIKRVLVATTDPNPDVAGKGIRKMREAGINVEIGLLKEEADDLNQVFFHYIQTGTPFVTLKSAMSLDGKTATITGESKWISSEESRADVHEFRHKHDAILVGVNTIKKDNPSLTTRLKNGGKSPIRVILDTRLQTPLDSQIVMDGLAPTWIVTGKDVDQKTVDYFEKKGIVIMVLDQPKISIKKTLKVLGKKGITSLYVEGGSEIHGSFLIEKAFQQVITYIAPKLIGGRAAPTTFRGEGIANIAEIVDLKMKSVTMIGEDIRIIAIPK